MDRIPEGISPGDWVECVLAPPAHGTITAQVVDIWDELQFIELEVRTDLSASARVFTSITKVDPPVAPQPAEPTERWADELEAGGQ